MIRLLNEGEGDFVADGDGYDVRKWTLCASRFRPRLTYGGGEEPREDRRPPAEVILSFDDDEEGATSPAFSSSERRMKKRHRGGTAVNRAEKG